MTHFFNKIILLISAGLLSACVSYTKPQVPASTFTTHRVASQQYILGVERIPPPKDAFITTEDIISAARRRGIFRHVDYIDSLPSPPDVVLRGFSYSTDTRPRCQEGNMLFVLTLGVIPGFGPVFHPVSFTVSTREGIVLRHVVEERQEKAACGWLVGISWLFPTWGSSEDKPAHADYVLSQILDALPHR